MKGVHFKVIILSSLLVSTTAHAYYNTETLQSWTDADLKEKGLRLAARTRSLEGDTLRENYRAYNWFKLAVLSQEEAHRGFNPTFAANPEDYVTKGVYAYLASQKKVDTSFCDSYLAVLDESTSPLSALEEFVTGLGIQAKKAPAKPYAVDNTPLIEPEMSHELRYKSTREFHAQATYESSTEGICRSDLPDSVATFDPAHLSFSALELFESKQGAVAIETPRILSPKIEENNTSNAPVTSLSLEKSEIDTTSYVEGPWEDPREGYLRQNGWRVDPAYLPDVLSNSALPPVGDANAIAEISRSVSMEIAPENSVVKVAVTVTPVKVTSESFKENTLIQPQENAHLLNDVRKDRLAVAQKNKRPPTLRRNLITIPTETKVEGTVLAVENPKEEVKAVIASQPISSESVVPAVEKARRLSVGGTQLGGLMTRMNMGDLRSGLKKTTPKQNGTSENSQT